VSDTGNTCGDYCVAAISVFNRRDEDGQALEVLAHGHRNPRGCR
jgi:hypothetical protein